MVKETGERGKTETCCGAYCSEVCTCIAAFAARQAKAKEGMTGEIKMVAKMKTNEERTEYLAEVAKARGKKCSDELRRKVWEHMQGNG